MATDDAEASLMARELQDAAVALLGDLSESDRETLRSTFWDEVGGGDPGTRKRRQRALARLRDAFRRTYGLS